jgi:hypothetical protein
MSTKLSKVMQSNLSYNEGVKKIFHKQAKSDLRKLAKSLGMQTGEFDVRSNMGGIAVSGEVTLHSDTIYIQISQGFAGNSILFRTCEHRKDYTGGNNNFAGVSCLDSDEFKSRIENMIR